MWTREQMAKCMRGIRKNNPYRTGEIGVERFRDRFDGTERFSISYYDGAVATREEAEDWRRGLAVRHNKVALLSLKQGHQPVRI
jgi:hypothetical protein